MHPKHLNYIDTPIHHMITFSSCSQSCKKRLYTNLSLHLVHTRATNVLLSNLLVTVTLKSQCGRRFNWWDSGFPESRAIFTWGKFPGNFYLFGISRHKHYHEHVTILLLFDEFLSILYQ